MTEFEAFPKIPRLRREIVVTEKIDGTNAAVLVEEVPGPWSVDPDTALDCIRRPDGATVAIYAQSRNRFITPTSDNYGFATWVLEHSEELAELGPGRHFGEWYGRGINRGYDLPDRRFALFNTGRWDNINAEPERFGRRRPPECCDVVPKILEDTFSDIAIDHALRVLREHGSGVAGFMRPEGIVIFHSASRQSFKVLLEGDDWPKSLDLQTESDFDEPPRVEHAERIGGAVVVGP